jgi:hypothetical protein
MCNSGQTVSGSRNPANSKSPNATNSSGIWVAKAAEAMAARPRREAIFAPAARAIDGRTYAGEVEMRARADVAVERFADVQRESEAQRLSATVPLYSCRGPQHFQRPPSLRALRGEAFRAPGGSARTPLLPDILMALAPALRQPARWPGYYMFWPLTKC